ncbi:MAG: efflux RND transporter periplasmic adaptor subunit [Hyphomonadaceae bacterium]|nr:efflux RND transporter periplasmic adaptor subunit [Hyphomonadaceae bacterium]
MSGPYDDADQDEQPKKRFAGIAVARRTLMVLAPIGVIVGTVAVLGALNATRPKPEKKDGPPNPVAVQVAPVEQRSTKLSITVQGEARPRVQAALAAQVAGRIVWADPAFGEGGAFAAGQTLVRIDDADYRLAVIRARAQVAEAQQAVTREEAEGEIAKKDWETIGNGQASPLALREPQLAQARAMLDAAQAQLRGAELDLERTNIRAPFAGRVRVKRANIGDYVAPGAPVADVFSTEVIEVRVPLADADLAILQTSVGFTARPGAGAPAHITASVGGVERRWEGRLVRTEAAIDPQTRLVYGFVEVRDPFAARNASPLPPGLFVTIHIDGARSENFFAAPRGALKRNEYVYVVNPDNTIDVRTVKAAQTTGDEVYFRTGLAAGERVVVSHLPSPRDGMKVTPIARAASIDPDGAGDLRQRTETE